MKKIGTDESGKGDYFGYLIVAGVLVDGKDEEILKKIGVKDSKRISDAQIHKIAAKIKKMCDFECVRISPEKYNVLHKKFGNLNKILAWAHSKVIENLLERNDAEVIIIDKFADEEVIKKELEKKKIRNSVRIEVRAESDMAVAAASIIARSEFLRSLRMLGREVGIVLPKGATHVHSVGNEIVKRYGREILDKVAKTHFKTTKNVGKKG